jgi:hypothetical protein
MIAETTFAERYVAIWNEPDAAARRAAVAALWTEDAVQYLRPSEPARDAAAELDVEAVFIMRGHAELERRVTRAYEQFVGSGQMTFRLAGDVVRVHDAVKLAWEGVGPDGEALGGGVDILLLAADGRIRTQYQFV